MSVADLVEKLGVPAAPARRTAHSLPLLVLHKQLESSVKSWSETLKVLCIAWGLPLEQATLYIDGEKQTTDAAKGLQHHIDKRATKALFQSEGIMVPEISESIVGCMGRHSLNNDTVQAANVSTLVWQAVFWLLWHSYLVRMTRPRSRHEVPQLWY